MQVLMYCKVTTRRWKIQQPRYSLFFFMSKLEFYSESCLSTAFFLGNNTLNSENLSPSVSWLNPWKARFFSKERINHFAPAPFWKETRHKVSNQRLEHVESFHWASSHSNTKLVPKFISPAEHITESWCLQTGCTKLVPRLTLVLSIQKQQPQQAISLG